MAQEIRFEFGVKVAKDGHKLVTWDNERTLVDMEGEFTSSKEQLIGTVAEQLDFGTDIAIEGFLVLKNLDDTVHNTIEIGVLSGSTFVPFSEIHVGDPRFALPVSGLAYYARASTSNAMLQFSIFER